MLYPKLLHTQQHLLEVCQPYVTTLFENTGNLVDEHTNTMCSVAVVSCNPLYSSCLCFHIRSDYIITFNLMVRCHALHFTWSYSITDSRLPRFNLGQDCLQHHLLRVPLSSHDLHYTFLYNGAVNQPPAICVTAYSFPINFFMFP